MGHESTPPPGRLRAYGTFRHEPGRAEPSTTPIAGNSVLELFTSQGCSSCPPADALLAELAKKPGIVTLSYSVDYWNYLGWRDTLSSAANSDRQREYAARAATAGSTRRRSWSTASFT